MKRIRIDKKLGMGKERIGTVGLGKGSGLIKLLSPHGILQGFLGDLFHDHVLNIGSLLPQCTELSYSEDESRFLKDYQL